ncbi:MAG: hypothetical protein JWN94_3519 [Betaproteobacteria bacterium]|nr:hypothetical protein [Betaproteobacteria bacterium]
MTDTAPQAVEREIEPESATKTAKKKPTKVLPTDRVAFTRQLAVLRGYAAAAGADRKGVSNEEVCKVVNLHVGTVSVCNPFFRSIGLLGIDKAGYAPSEEAMAYADRFKWDEEKAGHKLGPLMQGTWFAATLIPKLNFRNLTKEEAVAFLADASGAEPEFKAQLELLIDYLRAAGLVTVDGNMVSAAAVSRDDAPPATSPTPAVHQPPLVDNRLREIHPSIVGVLLKLPSSDGPWTNKEKKRFMGALSAVLDLVYDLEEDPASLV